MQSKSRIGGTSLMNARNSSRCGLCLGPLSVSHIIPDRWRHCGRRCPPRGGISRLSQARGKQKIRRRGGITTSPSPVPVTYLSPFKKKDALAWGVQGWAKDSQAKTEEIRRHGPRAPATWVLVEGRDNIPPSAFVVGNDKDNNPVFVARAYVEHGLRTFYRSYSFHLLTPCFRDWKSLP
jgi:hypothetical protein